MRDGAAIIPEAAAAGVASVEMLRMKAKGAEEGGPLVPADRPENPVTVSGTEEGGSRLELELPASSKISPSSPGVAAGAAAGAGGTAGAI